MMCPRWSFSIGLVWTWLWPLGMVQGADPSARPLPLTYEQHVRPILKARCFQCHGEEEKPKAKLDLRLARRLIQGGVSGAAILPGRHEESLLWERIDGDEMPPGEKKLSPLEKATIAGWIDQGAPTARAEPESPAKGPGPTEEERTFWSFQP